MGYCFFDREQEDLCLRSINDEFANRVGLMVTCQLSQDDQMRLCALPRNEIHDYVKKLMPEIDCDIQAIRKKYLEELKQNRLSILMGANIRLPSGTQDEDRMGP